MHVLLDDAARVPEHRAGWGACTATGRSSRACASCCARFTGTRGMPAVATSRRAPRCSSGRRCSASCASDCAVRSRRSSSSSRLDSRSDQGTRVMVDLSLLPDGGGGWLDASGDHADIVLSTRDSPRAQRRGLCVHGSGARRRAAADADAGARSAAARAGAARTACCCASTRWRRPTGCCCTSGIS